MTFKIDQMFVIGVTQECVESNNNILNGRICGPIFGTFDANANPSNAVCGNFYLFSSVMLQFKLTYFFVVISHQICFAKIMKELESFKDISGLSYLYLKASQTNLYANNDSKYTKN